MTNVTNSMCQHDDDPDRPRPYTRWQVDGVMHMCVACYLAERDRQDADAARRRARVVRLPTE